MTQRWHTLLLVAATTASASMPVGRPRSPQWAALHSASSDECLDTAMGCGDAAGLRTRIDLYACVGDGHNENFWWDEGNHAIRVGPGDDGPGGHSEQGWCVQGAIAGASVEHLQRARVQGAAAGASVKHLQRTRVQGAIAGASVERVQRTWGPPPPLDVGRSASMRMTCSPSSIQAPCNTSVAGQYFDYDAASKTLRSRNSRCLHATAMGPNAGVLLQPCQQPVPPQQQWSFRRLPNPGPFPPPPPPPSPPPSPPPGPYPPPPPPANSTGYWHAVKSMAGQCLTTACPKGASRYCNRIDLFRCLKDGDGQRFWHNTSTLLMHVGPDGGKEGAGRLNRPGFCLQGASGSGGSPSWPRSSIQAPCNTSEAVQQFVYSQTDRTLRSHSGLCLEAGPTEADASVLLAPCSNGTATGLQQWIFVDLPPGPTGYPNGPYPPAPPGP